MTEEKEKKKLKILIGFLSANKIDNYSRDGGRGEIQKNLQNKTKK